MIQAQEGKAIYFFHTMLSADVQKLKIQFPLQLLQIVFQKLDIHRLDSFILVQKVQGTQLTNDEN